MDGTILVLTLGGTIAMSAGGDSSSVVPQLGGADLTRAAGKMPTAYRDVRRVPGGSLTWPDLGRVVEEIHEGEAEGYAGFVVTMGTDTLEEFAFALELILSPLRRPLVVTGGMRSADHAGRDGPANIRDAVRVALATAAAESGVLVVIAGEIHAARYVRKSNTFVPHAFSSSPGAVGWVSEDVAHLHLRPHALEPLPVVASFEPPVPRVPIYATALADDGALLDRVNASTVDGLVVEGFGVGHVPGALVARLQEVAAEVPTYLVSRAGTGPLAWSTYGFPGSEQDLLARGLMHGGHLDAYKARMVLMTLLSGGASPKQIDAYFEENFRLRAI